MSERTALRATLPKDECREARLSVSVLNFAWLVTERLAPGGL
jgi:hypothetical protein